MSDKGDDGVFILATQGSITLLGNISGKALGFIFVAVATRLVTPSEYGIFTLGLSIVLFIQGFSSLNIYRSVDYFLPQHIDDSQYGKAKKTLQNIILFGIAGSLLGATLLLLSKQKLADIFNEPAIAYFIPYLVIIIPLQTGFQILLASFNSIKSMKYRVMMKDVINPLSRTVGAIVLVTLGTGVLGLIGGYFIGLMAAVTIGALFLISEASWLRSAEPSKISNLSIISYSLPLALAGVIYSIVGQIDYFVIGYFLGSSPVGQYRVGYLLAGNLLIVLTAVTPIFKPMVAESKSDSGRLKRHYQLATRWVTLCTIPIAITLVLAPKTYLSILFTEQYTAASAAVIALVVGYLLNASFGPEGMVLEGLGYTRLTLFNTTVLVIVNVLLDIILIPILGILGAGIATGIALTVAGILGVLEIYLIQSISPFGTNLIRVWIAGVPAGIIGYIFVTTQVKDIFIFILLPILVTFFYFIGLRSTGGFTQDERVVANKIDESLGISLFRFLIPKTE